MKHNNLFLVGFLMMLSCSKKPADTATRPNSRAKALPFEVTIVETPQMKESQELTKKATSLLLSKQYDQLEALAQSLRESKEKYSNGTWKLFCLYQGLDLEPDASNEEFSARLALFRDWCSSKADSVTARVALADLLVSFAWKARGSAYADKVPDQAWQAFFSRLKDAREILKRAKTLKQQCPVFWSVLLRVDLGLQTERAEYDRDFDAATTAWPDYCAYYSRRANYLLPRWNGEEGEWQKDLAQSTDKIGGQNGDMLYSQTIWAMVDYIDDNGNSLRNHRLSWARVDRGFKTLLERFPDSLAAKNERARLAWIAGEDDAACKYFEETEGKVVLSVWGTQEYLNQFVDWFRRQRK